MLPVSGIGNPPPVPPLSGSGHGDHAANATAPNTIVGQSFSATLAQAISQSPGGSAHSDHGGAGSGRNAATSVPNGDSHPRHFPIGALNHGGEHGFQETALGLRAYRQQLIASNIANADTPGYKAVDIDFQEALRIARTIANIPPLTLSTTVSGHIPGQLQSSAPSYPLKYHIPAQPSVDGNTVEMDVERSKFAENAVMYEFSLGRVKGHFMMIADMLKNLKD
ncbi:MAG: flagellar basal body rod protein FlgB [Betaproteobacteria bacterium]|nr:flagellar basal body rod protein FlgB [Betaproteobacteria bacterium]